MPSRIWAYYWVWLHYWVWYRPWVWLSAFAKYKHTATICYTVCFSETDTTMSLQAKLGSQCLSLVSQASDCLKTNPQATQQHLQMVRETVPTFLEELKKRERNLEKKRDDIQREETALHRQIGEKEDSKRRLEREIGEIRAMKARNEASLEDAKRDLREAENQRRDAQNKKDNAIAGTVGGGIGAVVLGIFFPPSLAVTVPAVAAAGTISISEADRKVDSCKERISGIRQSLEKEERQIRIAEDNITNIDRDISALNSKLTAVYEERGQLRNMMQKAVTYFGELQAAVEVASRHTDLFYKLIVELANKKEEYVIPDSKGGITVAGSQFANAWEKVEEKVMSGDAAGYMYLGIEFV